MEEKEILEICEEIEGKYIDLDFGDWREICQMLVDRLN